MLHFAVLAIGSRSCHSAINGPIAVPEGGPICVIRLGIQPGIPDLHARAVALLRKQTDPTNHQSSSWSTHHVLPCTSEKHQKLTQEEVLKACRGKETSGRQP